MLVVLYCLMEVTEGVISSAYIVLGTSFLCRVFIDLRYCKTFFLISYILWYSFCHFEVLVLKVKLLGVRFLYRCVEVKKKQNNCH